MPRLLPALTIVILSTTLTAATTGCQTVPSEVDPAPMGEAGQKKLRNSLLGTWKHTHVLDTAGSREAVGDRVVTWKFAEGGTGTHRVRSTPEADPDERSFQWRLEGRNIIVEFDDGPDARYFRA